MAKRFSDLKTMWELKFRCDGLSNVKLFQSREDALTFLARVIDYSTCVKLTLVIEELKDFTEDALQRVHKYKEMKSC